MGEVRITSGALRGRRVETPAGEGTRPLLTRLRKSLADLLRPRLAGARVLDLFGGSGAVAFELLSNGAESACVVELDPAAADLIRANASKLQARTEVFTADALRVLPVLAERGARFDVVVVAPPYGKGLQQAACEAVARGGLVAPGGMLVVQRDAREPAVALSDDFHLDRSRRYGRTVFDLYLCSP